MDEMIVDVTNHLPAAIVATILTAIVCYVIMRVLQFLMDRFL